MSRDDIVKQFGVPEQVLGQSFTFNREQAIRGFADMLGMTPEQLEELAKTHEGIEMGATQVDSVQEVYDPKTNTSVTTRYKQTL